MGYGAIKNVVICGFIVGNGSALTALNYNSIINSPDLSVYSTNTNVNNLSSNTTLSINGHTTQLSNLNSTSNSLLNNINSLSSQSFFYNNYTNLSNLNVSGITKLNGATTCIGTLNVVGNIIENGTAITNLNYNAITNPPTIISFNNPGTFVSTLNISGNTTINNPATCVSTLNISGKTTTQDLQVNGVLKLPNNGWIIDSNTNVLNNQRIYFDNIMQKHILEAVAHLEALY